MKHILTFAILGVALLTDAAEYRDIEARVIPVPQKIEVVSDATFPLKEDVVFKVVTPLEAESVAATVVGDVRLYWHFTPKVICEKGGEKIPDEGYQLDTTTIEFVITASSLSGVRNALRSMRQLAEPERGVARSTGFVIPRVKMDDFPNLKLRGFHYCDKNELWRIERAIRLAAYFKFNLFVLQLPMELKKHPEYVPENALTQEEVRRFVKLGKSLGLVMVPQIQILGHQGEIVRGGQILLDQDPAWAPLFEPSGSSWCISNPAAVKYIEEVASEYLDVFENPPYIHAGCDEAYNAGSCSLCRQGGEYWKKVAAHLTHFHDFFAARNCRMMLWHDMLVEKNDPAWKGSTANGGKDAAKLRSALPRDIIICYWEYGMPQPGGVAGFPIFDVLQKEGFPVVNSGWRYDTTEALGEKAYKEGGAGILQTTWGELNNSHRYHTIYAQGSTSGWNSLAHCPPVMEGPIYTVDLLNRYVRDVNSDMGIKDPAKTGTK